MAEDADKLRPIPSAQILRAMRTIELPMLRWLKTLKP